MVAVEQNVTQSTLSFRTHVYDTDYVKPHLLYNLKLHGIDLELSYRRPNRGGFLAVAEMKMAAPPYYCRVNGLGGTM